MTIIILPWGIFNPILLKSLLMISMWINSTYWLQKQGEWKLPKPHANTSLLINNTLQSKYLGDSVWGSSYHE